MKDALVALVATTAWFFIGYWAGRRERKGEIGFTVPGGTRIEVHVPNKES